MEIESKIVKNGNSYAMAIPKALVRCKILEIGKKYILKLEDPDDGPIVYWLEANSNLAVGCC